MKIVTPSIFDGELSESFASLGRGTVWLMWRGVLWSDWIDIGVDVWMRTRSDWLGNPELSS